MLLHDTGKATAFYGHGSMHGHEMYSARIANDVLTRLKAPNALREEVVKLVRWHMFDLKGETRVRKIKKKFVELGRDGAQKLILIREADVHGSGIVLGSGAVEARFCRNAGRKRSLYRKGIEMHGAGHLPLAEHIPRPAGRGSETRAADALCLQAAG